LENEEEEEEDDDDGEEEEGEDDEFIDVLDVLDGRGEIDDESNVVGRPRPTIEERGRRPFETGDGGDHEDDREGGDNTDSDDSMEHPSADDDDELAFTPSDIEDAPPEALDELQNFISALSPLSKKRKALDSADTSSSALVERSRKQRRLSLKERTEAGVENEFRAQHSGTSLQFPFCCD
jgi:U3 small nucleolar RNA-associated protein 14